MAVTWLSTPKSLTLPAASAWNDVDVSADVPAGAEGVILHYYNDEAANNQIGFQKNGSTDQRKRSVYNNGHMSLCIGVDSNRIFEIWTDDNINQKV
ncbi:MAG: hypothetical protein ACE5E0_03435, partial [Terriglobia bacterium]